MSVYAIVLMTFSLSTILASFCEPVKMKNTVFFLSAGTLIFLFAVQAPGVGADTATYMRYYQQIRQMSFRSLSSVSWEQGYVFVNWILGQLFTDSRAIVVVMSFFILVPIFRWMKRESLWTEMSLLIFIGAGMWSSSMGIFRQWCAMAILTFSYKNIIQRRFIPFLLNVMVAMLFHRTSAIFVIAYFAYGIDVNFKIMLLSIPMSLVLGLGGERILNFLNRFALNQYSAGMRGGVNALIFLWICVMIIFFAFRGKIPQNLKLAFNMVYIAAVTQPIALTFANWARLGIYFSISLTILLPNTIVELTKTRKNYVFRLPASILICIAMTAWFAISAPNQYVFM